jgi:hypothetical protein
LCAALSASLIDCAIDDGEHAVLFDAARVLHEIAGVFPGPGDRFSNEDLIAATFFGEIHGSIGRKK